MCTIGEKLKLEIFIVLGERQKFLRSWLKVNNTNTYFSFSNRTSTDDLPWFHNMARLKE